MDMRLLSVILGVVISMLLVAVTPLPYGYFTFLRWVVCLLGVALAIYEWRNAGRVSALVIMMGLIAIVFNPLAPVYLSKSLWVFIDVAVAVILAVYWGFRFHDASERTGGRK